MNSNKENYLNEIKVIIDNHNRFYYKLGASSGYVMQLQFDEEKDEIEVELHYKKIGDDPHMYIGYQCDEAYMESYAIQEDNLDEHGTFVISPFTMYDLKSIHKLMKAITNYYDA